MSLAQPTASRVSFPASLAGSDHCHLIEAYYRAFREKDREALRALLAPDFRFVSAFAECRERETLLQDPWAAVGRRWATDISIFGSGPEYVVLYRHEPEPGEEGGQVSMAERIRFKGDLIAEVELFVGRSLPLQRAA